MQVTGGNFDGIALPALDDGVMHYFPSRLQEYMGVHISQTIIWIVSFFGVSYASVLIISRFDCLTKPVRETTRTQSLQQNDRIVSFSSRNTEQDYSIEDPREDVVYAGLRRFNGGITQRLALQNPLGQILVVCFISASVVILIISISTT